MKKENKGDKVTSCCVPFYLSVPASVIPFTSPFCFSSIPTSIVSPSTMPSASPYFYFCFPFVSTSILSSASLSPFSCSIYSLFCLPSVSPPISSLPSSSLLICRFISSSASSPSASLLCLLQFHLNLPVYLSFSCPVLILLNILPFCLPLVSTPIPSTTTPSILLWSCPFP